MGPYMRWLDTHTYGAKGMRSPIAVSMTRAALCIGFLAALSACAPEFSALTINGEEGIPQNITVSTNPPGATCTLVQQGRLIATANPTPRSVTVLQLEGGITITCNEAGYQTARTVLHSDVAGSVIIGSLLPVTPDIYPHSVALTLVPGSPSEAAPAAAGSATGAPQQQASEQAGYAAGREAAFELVNQNYFDLLAQAYRSLPAKPPLPEEVRKEKIVARAALQNNALPTAIQVFSMALKSAPWWPQGNRDVALAMGRLHSDTVIPSVITGLPDGPTMNHWTAAIEMMKRYLAFAPDAPDAPQMQAKITEWSRLGPPPPIPPLDLPTPPGGWPGLGIIPADVPAIVASARGKPDLKGALVVFVLPGSLAEKAGLARGDIIVAVNGAPVNSAIDLRVSLINATPGGTLQLGVLRGKHMLALVAQKPVGLPKNGYPHDTP